MKNIGILIKMILLVCLLGPSLFANDYKWNVIMISGDTLGNCRLDSISSSKLFVSTRSHCYSIFIDSIAIIAHLGKSHFLSGAAYGAVIGIICGVVLTPDAPKTKTLLTDIPGNGPVYIETEDNTGKYNKVSNGVIGGAIGFLLGGYIGAAIDQDQIYDLSSIKNITIKKQMILTCIGK